MECVLAGNRRLFRIVYSFICTGEDWVCLENPKGDRIFRKLKNVNKNFYLSELDALDIFPGLKLNGSWLTNTGVVVKFHSGLVTTKFENSNEFTKRYTWFNATKVIGW